MRIGTLFLIIFMTLGSMVYAQKTEKETSFALDFNDYCASLTDSLFVYGSAWGDAFGTAYKTKNFILLTPYADRILSVIEKSQKELVKRRINPDMEDLKIAVLDLLSFEKSMLKEAFRPFEKFTDKTSEETIKAQLDLLTEKATQEDELLKAVQLEQEKMANLYEFTMEANDGE